MRITLIGTLHNVGKMVETYRELERLGHRPQMLEHMFGLADGTNRQLIGELEEDRSAVKRNHDFFRKWHELIRSGDAVLVCNYDKNGIRNYIGGNALIEMGFAHIEGKKVFLLNPIPTEVSYVDEIKALTDVVLDGDLGKIPRQ